MKKLMFALSLTMFFGLTGCSNSFSSPSTDSTETTNQSTGVETDEGSTSPVSTGSGNSLVFYFSATGHTETVARYIANHTGSPLHELTPVEPYTDEDLDYTNPNSRTSIERTDRYRSENVVELVETDFADFNKSSYIFLGAPVWHGNMSWVINDFVLSNDFSGKTIIPFATSSSSGIDVARLEFLSDTATWLEGRRFRISEISQETVESWVDSLGIAF